MAPARVSRRGLSRMDDLHGYVRRLHRAAGKKVYRIQRQGVNIRGTFADPRADFSKMSTDELMEYGARLESFVDRRTQFVAGHKGTPLARSAWTYYKELEREYNAKVNKRFDAVKHLTLPSGETIAERMEKITPSTRRLMDQATASMYDPVKRVSTGVMSRSALERLQVSLEKKLSPDYRDKELAGWRDQFTQMIDATGNTDLKKRVLALSDDQFMVLWNYTKFANSLSLGYLSAQADLSPNQRAFMSDVAVTQMKEAAKHVKWAEKLRFGR